MSVPESRRRYEALIGALHGCESVAVAFSGGVDSTLLLWAALQALGKEKVFVIRGISRLLSREEREGAGALLDHLGVDREMRLAVELHPLDWPEFVVNDATRCYVCKKRMYQRFLTEIEKRDCALLLDGSNVDDRRSGRPGFRAIDELGVRTPLLDAGLTKEFIRSLASTFQLPNHDKPSNSCLATRFPEGTLLDREGLALVERCEAFLLGLGFSGCRVRPGPEKNVVLQVRAEDIGRFGGVSVRSDVVEFFESLGFSGVLLDLQVRP